MKLGCKVIDPCNIKYNIKTNCKLGKFENPVVVQFSELGLKSALHSEKYSPYIANCSLVYTRNTNPGLDRSYLFTTFKRQHSIQVCFYTDHGIDKCLKPLILMYIMHYSISFCIF